MPTANKAPKPAPNIPLGPIDLTMTVGEETLKCKDTYGICRVVTEHSLKKAVVLQGDLNQFFYDPEEETLRFQVTCPSCFSAPRDGTVEITPPAARTSAGHPSPAIKIFPEIGDDSLEFHVTAIDPHGNRTTQDLTINVMVTGDDWNFDELVSLSYDLGETRERQTNNAIDLRNYITPTNPDVTFQVSLSDGSSANGLSWTLSSQAADGGRSYLEFAAADRTEPGRYDFTVTATHPNRRKRQRSLTVEIIEAEEMPGACDVSVTVTENEGSCLSSGRLWYAELTTKCDRALTVKNRWTIKQRNADGTVRESQSVELHHVVGGSLTNVITQSSCYFSGRIVSNPRFQYCVAEGAFGVINPAPCTPTYEDN